MERCEPSVAIVIPAYNAARHLERVLPAAMRAAGSACVLVVDPGSTDDTAHRAEALGARVLRLGERAGPARARNEGVAASHSDVVLFIDSDCVPHADVVDRVREAFATDPELVSLTGSYDAAPPEQNFASQYMNLRHHHTHQQARQEGATFWAGLGAVRREAFDAVGGFDAARFPRPQIEDTELGLRLREKGRTRLDPELNVTHLKRWSLRGVVETDILARGVPWSRVILERGEMPDDLNLRASQRVAAALAPFTLLALAALPWLLLSGAGLPSLAALALIGVSLYFQRGLVGCFARARGPLFAFAAWAFHLFHLSYSAATFAVCALQHRLRRG